MMSLFDARFYDLAVHSLENGDSTTRFAFEAKRYGYSGIAIINPELNNLDQVRKPDGFMIYPCIEISAVPGKIRNEIKKYGSSILMVRGGGEDLNRAAVEAEGLDILMQPAKFNNVLAKAAEDTSVALGFNTGTIIRMRGEVRVRELRIMKTNLMYARKYGLRMILTGEPSSLYDLRSPREMAALAGLFGMTEKEAVNAMSTAPLEILRRKNRDYIQEGIEIL